MPRGALGLPSTTFFAVNVGVSRSRRGALVQVELGLVEQRHKALLEVLNDGPVAMASVARRRVERQALAAVPRRLEGHMVIRKFDGNGTVGFAGADQRWQSQHCCLEIGVTGSGEDLLHELLLISAHMDRRWLCREVRPRTNGPSGGPSASGMVEQAAKPTATSRLGSSPC